MNSLNIKRDANKYSIHGNISEGQCIAKYLAFNMVNLEILSLYTANSVHIKILCTQH